VACSSVKVKVLPQGLIYNEPRRDNRCLSCCYRFHLTAV
jgi:hypothetical protein